MIDAIRAGQVEIVPDVMSVTADEVLLDDGAVLRPDVIMAATGFGTGLDPMVGHLGVLTERGMPRAWGGPAVLPGLRFIGYLPNLENFINEARAIAEQVSRELGAGAPVGREPAGPSAV